MKNYTASVLLITLFSMTLTGPVSLPVDDKLITDTLPDICTVLPSKEIEALHPFTNSLSASFPDPNNFETYNGCHYQFFSDKDKPQLAVRLIKWNSKQEAADEYKMQVQQHVEMWGLAPERLYVGADSVYFSIDPMDSTECDECGLVAMQGVYTVYVSFKGQPKGITRAGKKMVSLNILKMMFDRVPGLAPSRIRNKQ